MLGELHHFSGNELLYYVKLILCRPSELSDYDRTELAQINREFVERDRVGRLQRKLQNGSPLTEAEFVSVAEEGAL